MPKPRSGLGLNELFGPYIAALYLNGDDVQVRVADIMDVVRRQRPRPDGLATRRRRVD